MPKEDYRIDYKLVRTMAEAFAEESFECEKATGLVNTTTGEEKDANRLILNDNLYRLQEKIAKLWMYISGSAEFEPLVRDMLNKETTTENVVVPTINEQPA